MSLPCCRGDDSLSEFLEAPNRARIEAMAEVIRPYVMETPLLPFAGVHLKLENLQWAGAFKNRTAAALLGCCTPDQLAAGVVTASSGNFGISLAALAARRGIAATVVVPASAPAGKLERLRETGAHVVKVSAETWWQTIVARRWADNPGIYLDAVADANAIAGNGTVGLEILAQLPDVDTVFVPVGGGGLLCGIASAIKATRPQVRIIACESGQATPLTAAFRAGRPVDVPCHDGFISGIGAPAVLPAMWPLLQKFVDDVVVVSPHETAAALRLLLLQGHVLAEGAGAVAVAANFTGRIRGRRMVCVVSGGNMDAGMVATILAGGIPQPGAAG